MSYGWPLVPSTSFPGEKTLQCPRCKSTHVVFTIETGSKGTGRGGIWRMGDRGSRDVVICQSCGDKAYNSVECSRA
jgi:transcription elongation factor Elf1